MTADGHRALEKPMPDRQTGVCSRGCSLAAASSLPVLQNEATSALPKIITTGFRSIQLIYFFTAGDDEVKCWQIRKGAKAPQVLLHMGPLSLSLSAHVALMRALLNQSACEAFLASCLLGWPWCDGGGSFFVGCGGNDKAVMKLCPASPPGGGRDPHRLRARLHLRGGHGLRRAEGAGHGSCREGGRQVPARGAAREGSPPVALSSSHAWRTLLPAGQNKQPFRTRTLCMVLLGICMLPAYSIMLGSH